MAYQSPCSGFLFHNDQFGPSLPPQHLHGGAFLMKRSMSFDHMKSCDQDQGVMNGDDEVSDDGSQLGLGEKKKRLSLEQVKALEKSFEVANKLDPERKLQLAKALGLQPRQVAIWFQNRRARWKTKTLERDYDLLKKQFDALKADNDTLHAQNNKLHAQLRQLKTRDSNERGGNGIGIGIGLFKKERDEGSWSNGSDNTNTNTNTSDLNLVMMNSPVSSELSTKHLFNTSLIRPATATGMTQLLQDETLSNMFGTIEDQPGMWTWPDHHHFN